MLTQAGVEAANQSSQILGVPNAQTIALISLFGIVGAAFSAIVSTSTVPAKGRIPEHLSAVALTISRAAIGARAALLLVFALRSGLVSVANLNFKDPLWALVLAFAAGSSERLVVRAVESISSRTR